MACLKMYYYQLSSKSVTLTNSPTTCETTLIGKLSILDTLSCPEEVRFRRVFKALQMFNVDVNFVCPLTDFGPIHALFHN